MPRKPITHAQRMRQVHGRTQSDRGYDRRRMANPYTRRAKQIRSSARWQKARDRKLKRNPLCEEHEKNGDVVAADQVDHIVSLFTLLSRYSVEEVANATPAGAFDESNLMSLCTGCHAAKSAKERRQ